jgi:hypothetical protein
VTPWSVVWCESPDAPVGVSVYAEPVVVLAPHGVIETIVSDLLEPGQRTSEGNRIVVHVERAQDGVLLGRARPAARTMRSAPRPADSSLIWAGGQPWAASRRWLIPGCPAARDVGDVTVSA